MRPGLFAFIHNRLSSTLDYWMSLVKLEQKRNIRRSFSDICSEFIRELFSSFSAAVKERSHKNPPYYSWQSGLSDFKTDSRRISMATLGNYSRPAKLQIGHRRRKLSFHGFFGCDGVVIKVITPNFELSRRIPEVFSSSGVDNGFLICDVALAFTPVALPAG